MDLFKKAKGIKTRGIIGTVLIFTLIGIFVSAILALVDGITILSTDWKNKELDDSKLIWGILSLLLLGPIATLVFGSKATKALSSNTTSTNE